MFVKSTFLILLSSIISASVAAPVVSSHVPEPVHKTVVLKAVPSPAPPPPPKHEASPILHTATIVKHVPAPVHTPIKHEPPVVVLHTTTFHPVPVHTLLKVVKPPVHTPVHVPIKHELPVVSHPAPVHTPVVFKDVKPPPVPVHIPPVHVPVKVVAVKHEPPVVVHPTTTLHPALVHTPIHKPIVHKPRAKVPVHVPIHHSFDKWEGHESLKGFDNFYGVDNWDGYKFEQVFIKKEVELVCKPRDVHIIQQRFLVLQEMAKKIIVETICEVEVQTIVFEQFYAGLNGFGRDIRRVEGGGKHHQLGYDEEIVKHFPKFVKGDGSLDLSDWKFTGKDLGKHSVLVKGHNWDDKRSPSSVKKAFDAARKRWFDLYGKWF
ncbi:hypothetical protein BKA70DRAFT_1525115 [Coprinopsis sp. MPI-PUGE-AT-0042]|nr:hypothetical protein BKA70DRAFT_1525115 [Coprinopsis sp. MPI-PUGE-AT-0042]